jgi:folylpolyglutamate synthase/dihydropteroate synthase
MRLLNKLLSILFHLYFTSPFIETFNERISLNGYPISNDEIVELVSRVKPGDVKVPTS